MKMNPEVEKLRKEALELISGSSLVDRHEGHGMLKAINKLSKYAHGYSILSEYFDSISDEEKPAVHAALEELEL
jgi:hypothetical protein